ncbi:MAG: hypothetical protein IKN38_08515 [Clostridia bacterium]|nr:hypothetical protein [Clostridia bacterium]
MAKEAKTNPRDERKSQKAERKSAAAAAAKKKSRKNMIVFVCILVVLAMFAALLIFNKCSTSGAKERNTVVASTANFEVTQSMLTYMFNTSYNTYANYYSSDTDGFSSMVESVNSRGQYYDYFLSSAKQQAEQYLVLCELAKEAGITLDKEDYAEIDEVIDNYKQTQLSYSQSNSAYSLMTFDKFLETMFGATVNEDVVRDCLELSELAAKYQEQKKDELTADYTDEICESYYEENIDSYQYVDYLTYTFKDPEPETEDASDAEAVDGTDAAETEAAEDTAEVAEETEAETTEEAADDLWWDDGADYEEETEEVAADDGSESDVEPEVVAEPTEAEAMANELASKKNADAFNKYMTEYFKAEAEKTAEEGEEITDDSVSSQVEALAKTKQLKSSLSDDGAKEWAFADGTKVGSTYVVKDEENGQYTVYMITAVKYRVEELTKNAAILYLTDDNNDGDSQAKADEIKAEWDALADKSEKAFLELCEKYSESSHSHVEEGYTRDTSDIGEWFYEDGRAVGDVGVIHSDANSATYIVYFAGDGEEGWKASVKSAKASEDFESFVNDYVKAHMVNDDEENPSMVTFDEAAVKKVKPISLSTSSN